METRSISNAVNTETYTTPLLPLSSLSGLVHPLPEENVETLAHVDHQIEDDLKEFIQGGKHPCVGATAALNKDQYWLGVYSRMAATEDSERLARDLNRYLREQQENPREFATFMAVFKDEPAANEQSFETLLWSQLSRLDRISSVFFGWDPSVSRDPDDQKFSFSFGGKAFYVVGLHPGSSRQARRFRYSTLIFNLHSQFEAFRSSGRYDRMRDTIRSRDMKLQGSINPMMKDFGQASEARQYSGREVDSSWKCPFHSATSVNQTKGESEN